MKNITIVSMLLTAAALLNVGCTASAGIKKTDTTKLNSATQVAYVTAPVTAVPAGK